MRRNIILMCIALSLSISTYAFSGKGSGTEKDPYQITTADELFEVRNELTACYILMNDIDLCPWLDENNPIKGWTPIGNSTTPFNGTFDGNMKSILNLKIERPETSNVGFFGYIQSATIKNVTLINPQIIGKENVGAVCGRRCEPAILDFSKPSLLPMNISNCYVTGGNVSGDSSVGGIIGNIYGYSNTTYTNTISECFNSSCIEGNEYCGGICGEIQHSGRDNVSVNDCYSIGNVMGKAHVGGILGYVYTYESWVTNWTKEIPYFTFTRNYARGNIEGASSVGGLIGMNNTSGDHHTISKNVCIADTLQGDYRISSTVATADNYACLNTIVRNGNGAVVDVEDDTSNGISFSLRLLQKASTYQGFGWDLNNVWSLENEGVYPQLKKQVSAPTIEQFIAGSKVEMTGTANSNAGTVYVIIGGNLFSAPIVDSKWTVSLGNISEGEKAEVFIKTDNTFPSYLNYAFAGKGAVIKPEVIPGDANGDGVVDAADVVGTINCILGKQSASFNKSNADINNDGQVLVDDAVGTVQMIMDKQ